MITKELLKLGYNSGFIRLEHNPLASASQGVICRIGDEPHLNWFCFGGLTADESSVEEYMQNFTTDEILDEIYETLDDFRKCNYDEFNDEYAFYEEILRARFDNNFTPQAITM